MTTNLPLNTKSNQGLFLHFFVIHSVFVWHSKLRWTLQTRLEDYCSSVAAGGVWLTFGLFWKESLTAVTESFKIHSYSQQFGLSPCFSSTLLTASVPQGGVKSSQGPMPDHHNPQQIILYYFSSTHACNTFLCWDLTWLNTKYCLMFHLVYIDFHSILTCLNYVQKF